jgi:hypothetical protein
LCSNNVSLSTFGRRTFQSVDGDPEVASHLPLLQDTYFLLAEERRAAMQRAVFCILPTSVFKWHFRFQDPGGVHFSKGTMVTCLVDAEL